MQYNETVRDHFLRPRNAGELTDPDGLGAWGDPQCGDFCRVWLRVRDEKIHDIRFRVRGCAAAIATCSVMTTLALGRTLDEAHEITDEVIDGALGGLPAPKRHCSNLAASALHEAILDYVHRSVRRACPPPPKG
jgi:nitrogen fixation NifU-like protein